MTQFKTPLEVNQALVSRVREQRLDRNWTQEELADRAGITAASYRRFEQTGKISLERLLLVASALGSLNAFDQVFPPSQYKTLDEIESATPAETRKPRARKGATL
ncbi:MAG: helix-turn-helix transcriptional regulator [Verrucomicrobiota bacterium]